MKEIQKDTLKEANSTLDDRITKAETKIGDLSEEIFVWAKLIRERVDESSPIDVSEVNDRLKVMRRVIEEMEYWISCHKAARGVKKDLN